MSIVSYAAFSKDDNIRYNSSSGGLFSEFANYVFSKDGFVAGAVFDDDFKSVSHILTNNRNDLPKLTASKYLQSSFRIHKEIKSKLQNGDLVLCCGTPCQIAGLKAYLKADYENLYTIDFICHGTPLQTIWGKYTDWLEDKNNSKISFVNFRAKDNGWNNYQSSIKFESGKKYIQTCDYDPYMRLFLSNLSLSKGCFECKFKNNNRAADITIGDFWGIDEEIPEMNDDKGISAVIINTAKGNRLFSEITDNLIVREVDEKQISSHNICAVRPVDKPENYDTFIGDVDKLPFDKLAEKYLPKSSLKEQLKKYRLVRKLVDVKHHFDVLR